MRQITLASQTSFEKYARKSRREEFLTVMDVVVPWCELEALIEPFYPKAGIGGVQYEAPELADHLLAGRLLSLFRSTLRWSLARKKTVYRLVIDAFELTLASYNPKSLNVASIRPLTWTYLKPSMFHPVLGSFARWRKLSPVLLFTESIRYSLAQQLTCTDPPLTGCAEVRYPYLDRSLFVFLASIPRIQVLQAGQRRRLMRRALRGVVPDEVLLRKTKWFGVRNASAILSGQLGSVDAMFKDQWLTDRIAVDAQLVRKRLEEIQHGTSPEATALLTAIGIEQWLRSQLRNGVIQMTLPNIDCAAPL